MWLTAVERFSGEEDDDWSVESAGHGEIMPLFDPPGSTVDQASWTDDTSWEMLRHYAATKGLIEPARRLFN